MSASQRFVGTVGDFEVSLPKKKSMTLDRDKAWANFDQKATADEAGFQQSAKELARTQKRLFWKAFRAKYTDDAVSAIEAACEEVYGVKMDTATATKMAPAWARAVKSGYEIADNILGGGVSFDLYSPAFSKWVKAHGLEAAKEINGTTKEELLSLRPWVKESMEAGSSIKDIAIRLDHVYDKLGSTRAELIARTEVLGSINYGQFEVYKGEGVKRKEWLHAGVGVFSRETHMGVEPVDIDQPFDVPGADAPMMYPGDPAGGAGSVCNCRCALLPILEDE